MDVNFPQDWNEKFVKERLVGGIRGGNYIVDWRETTPGKLTLKDELNEEVSGNKKRKKAVTP